MSYAVETISLTKIFTDFWNRSKVYAVDNLNLQIKTNEVFGLLGPNGSGKTTTIKMLLGLLHPTKGKCLMLGGQGSDPKVNARIGYLPEESYLYRYLNARETLDFYGRLFKLPSKVRKTRIEALLDMVGLKAVANRSVGTYSKGMARRIGLAQALINDPEFLILDEPTTGLDPIGTRQIKDLIIKLAERGKTILLCSHLLADVEDVCDRIAILYGGKIQTQGQVRDLLQQTNKRQIVTDVISDSTVEKIKELVHSENAECEVTSPMDRLETFFIRTVETAQKQAKSTSGAVSTTKISDFLGAEDKAEGILDKLVSSSVEPELPEKDIATEQVESTPSNISEPNKELLSELTGPDVTDQIEKISMEDLTEKVESIESQKTEEINTDILNSLVNRPESGEQEDKQQPDKKSQAGGDDGE